MIDAAYVQRMARYNRWQNENLYGAAAGLSDEERRRERGAFFGSIHGTFNHLMWGDRTWMSRFSDVEAPGIPGSASASLYTAWDELVTARRALDDTIVAWSGTVSADWLNGNLSWYSGAAKRDLTKPSWILVTQFFNHQTHHRGQVHCMLTQAGAKPGDTDVFLMPE